MKRSLLLAPKESRARSGDSARRMFYALTLLLTAWLSLASNSNLLAQSSTITTTYANNNGSGTTTFNLHNTNTYDIIITEIGGVTGAAGSQTATLYYKTTPINGAPGTIDATNGWTLAATGTFTGVANTSTSVAQPVITGMSFTLPAGATYGMAVSSASFRYSTLTAGTPYVQTAGGVELITGDNIGYGGGTPPAAPTNTPRGFIGYITFVPATPCVAPPTGGQAASSVSTICPNTNFQLSLTGASGGMGMTYQWQSSPNGTTGWTNVTGATNANVTVSQTATAFYRAQLTCSGQTANSLPVQVTTNATPVTGTFTINKNAPASSTNFQSFTAAIASIQCGGASGPIVYNVVAGSGPYSEQVVVPVIPGTSATNTITFNGNGNTLTNSSASGDALKLDGAKYIRFNNLKAEADPTATAGTVVSLVNAAQNNIFNGCTFTHSTSTSSTSQAVYVYSGSSNNTFQNNTITGGYYSIYNYGASATLNNNNQFLNNTIKDPYYYAIYNYYSPGTLIEGNDISRPTRTNGTTLYGIYNSTGGTSVTISKNRIHNTHDVATSTGSVYAIYSGIAGTVGSENIVKNNVIYNINNTGNLLYALYNSGGNNTYYYHNTVSADNPAVTYSTLRGMYFASASTNVKFINNNISLTSPATTKHAIYLASSTIALVSNNNNLYVGSTGNVGYYSADVPTLAAWKAVNSGAYDQNSVSADPQFVNLATGDLKPINSTLNNIGVPVTPAVVDDITGAVRNTTTPDPGAYEFTPAANDAGLTAIISPTSPVTPGVSQPVTVTIKNYGLNPLTTATITWTVNGTAQTSYNWTGNLANNQTANATIGNYSFPAGNFALNICTSNPNGVTDANPGNDCQSMNVTSCNSLNGIYTINKNAPNSATNFTSFTIAANTLNSCGVSGPVTINVVAGSGPYTEVVEMTNISGASATNTVTFNGNANTLSSPTATADFVIKLNGAKYIRFNNLKIEANATTTDGTVVSLVNAAQFNTFNGNTITHSATTASTSQAVYIYSGSSDNTFQNNTIIGAYYGIYNYGSSTVANNNNQFIGNTVKDMYYYGIYNYYSPGSLIEGNDISRPTRANAGSMYGIYNSTNGTGVTISKNRIHNTHDAATSLTGTVYGIYSGVAGTVGSENIVKNNAIYNLGNTSGYVYALYNSGGNNTYYYYNTVAVDAATASYNTLRGMYFVSASTNVKFINNNISLASTATTKHAIYLTSTTISLVSNNNNLYAPGGNVGYYGAAMATLADWKLANSGAYDQASVSADPVFTSTATGNLRPTVVAVNDLGQPITGITDDITGAVRSLTTPDIGAFEFSVNPNDVGIISISGPSNTGCGLSATETITVTIKNFGSATQTSIPVSYSVNGTPVNATYTGSIAANATDTYTFTTKANLSTSGAYVIVAQTNLSGDSDASNNSSTLNITNSLIPGLPMTFDFETAATGINRFRTVVNPKSALTEAAGASNGTGSTKGLIMDGVDNTGWIPPVGVTDPWTNNMDNFSAAYICISPSGGAASDSLWLTFDLKQLFKVANANTNFRITVNGIQVGPTYRPPFSGTPIVWTPIKIDLTAYKNDPTVMIGLESSVKEAYANGAGTANLIDNVVIKRRIVAVSGIKGEVLANKLSVYPNPSTGNFNVKLDNGKAYNLEVTDLAGKTILKQTAKGDAQLKLENQAKGIYLLKVSSEGNSTMRKLIVE